MVSSILVRRGSSQKNKPPPKEPTPFEKFDRLVKKIVRVPKDRLREKNKRST